ncbi:glycosyltransferase [Cyanobium sp. Cruz CV11-17]|nr:glycosyltransferase [Cyanobium sp. Cruz CV11-17]
MNNSPIRIGLLYTGGRDWIGGEHYILNILYALKEFQATGCGETAFKVILCYEDEGLSDHIRKTFSAADDFRLIKTIGSPLRKRDVLIPVLNMYLPRKLRFLKAKARQFLTDSQGIDFLYPYDFRSVLSEGTHAVGWIADFQPRILPHFFGEENLKWRYEYEDRVSDRATDIVFSSQTCISDFKKFFPYSQAKPHLFRFYPFIEPNAWEQDPTLIQSMYNLPEKFFICCNQFWQHKNHIAVLESIASLSEANLDLFVVFTGHTQDNRLAEHFDNICSKINRLGIRPNIAILGLIPKIHQLQLLRRSIGVIQPSLSEGWSTVVEDARSLGKPMILSDLPVHLEQDPPRAVYYDNRSLTSLSKAMQEAWTDWQPGPNCDHEKKARIQSQILIQNMGERFLQIVTSVTTKRDLVD